MLKQFEIAHIRYTKSEEDESERFVLPTNLPSTNMKAIDVTELSDEDQQQLQTMFKEYKEYYKIASKNLFRFDDWLDHTHPGEFNKVKWRTFKLEKVEVLN